MEAIVANHSPIPDNYVEKKTFDEAMGEATPQPDPAREEQVDADKKARAQNKGEAARNGGGSTDTKA